MSSLTSIHNVIPRTDIVKRAARLGAEIKNIRLSDHLSDEVMRAINQLVLEHKVIFFRDQGHLDAADQERFAVRLGTLFPHPTIGAVEGTSTLDSDRGGGHLRPWDTDVTFVDGYPRSSVLRAVVILPLGGDTVWSNTAAAYLDLPVPLRMLADDLWAVHNHAYHFAVTAHSTEADEKHFDHLFNGTICEPKHPVVRVHPETGERTLVLSNFVQSFVGLQKYTGQKLFDLFQSYVTAPENIVRWSWKADDVAIWDNRATQHYAARSLSR